MMIKMKNIFLACLLTLFLFTSCEKVIDLNLNNSEKKYVIEAVLTDISGTAKVLLTQTKDFTQDNTFEGIGGAIVSIAENGGVPTLFNETSPGVYQSLITGSVGKEYTLSVTINGETFTASSVMPQRVNLDSIFVTDEMLFTDTRKIVSTIYQDPVGRGNNYRFLQYINGRKITQIIVNNDDYTDGRKIINKLFYFPDDDQDSLKIKSGDNIKVEMLCINEPIYKYWFSLDRSSTGGSSQATPSNPVSNIKGGALGYFSTHTLQSRSMIVP